jgi:hypothetical protein
MGRILNFMMILVLTASAVCAAAEETLTLLSYTNSWRYNQDGVEPNTAWKQPGFDDGTWLLGKGAFALPMVPADLGASFFRLDPFMP